MSTPSAAIDFAAYIPTLRRHSHAVAMLHGNAAYPGITGLVRMFQIEYGVLVEASLFGLPNPTESCRSPIFGFHIHAGEQCGSGSPMGSPTNEPFAAALGHFNPEGCDHPYHAGDMPPLVGCKGRAYQIFLTDRFELDEVIGRAVVVHAMPDDFTTQPSGASGQRIACGIIQANQ